jgi:NDP-sugar pyrophosphorylase family protein
MKAMILAAGIGSRLQPITNSIPKALIPLNGTPLISYIINRLKSIGITEIIINTHHFAEQIIDYITRKNKFNIRIEFSNEEELLDTGGGLKKAGWFFDDNQPFLLHNVDVVSNIDINYLLNEHNHLKGLATLAVRNRHTSRLLLFDRQMCVAGWQSHNQSKIIREKSDHSLLSFAFLGIHLISPEIFDFMPDLNRFSIVDAYLQISERRDGIYGTVINDGFWIDVGKPENIGQAERFLIEE